MPEPAHRWFPRELVRQVFAPCLVCIIFLSIACSRDEAESDRPVTAASADAPLTLLEDFENDRLWSQDSSGNHLTLASVDEPVSSGHAALAVELAESGRDKAIVRKEVAYDFTNVNHLIIDVHCSDAEPKMRCALAVRTDRGTVFECKAQQLHSGWNRSLSFGLDEEGIGGAKMEQWKAERHQVNRLLIELFNDGKKDQSLVFDRLCASPGTAVLRQTLWQISALEPFPESARRHEAIALHFALAAPADAVLAKPSGDAFLRHMTSPWIRLRGPDGNTVDLHAFCTGIDRENGANVYRYAARFSPNLTGLWEYQIGFDSAGQWSWAQPGAFTCQVDRAGPGKIVIDHDDRRYFSYESGDWYYPIGLNVAWAGDYGPYLDRIAAYGGNFVRAWICPWNNPLDVGGKLEVINFASAEAIDRLFDAAESHRVSVQLVLNYHGSLSDDWNRNPFNAANGGPCRDARDFWSDRTSKAKYKKLLDYVVARWAHSPRLFAWELWNEADLAPSWRPEDVIAWHREMADYLKAIDPYRHLITTSVASPDALSGLWRLENIDFAQLHQYDADLAQLQKEMGEFTAQLRIPAFIGESGRGWQPADDQIDPEGRHLRHAIWLAWMQHLAGNSMPWWWDTYVEPNGLERHFAPLVKFASGEDLRGVSCRSLERTLRTDPEVMIHALVGDRAVYGYIHAPFMVEQPKAEFMGPLIHEGRIIELSGLCSGKWQVEWWDTLSGTATAGDQISCGNDGVLRLPCPATLSDRAFKLKRLGATELDARLK